MEKEIYIHAEKESSEYKSEDDLIKDSYLWVRVFDYKFERDFNEKGIMLDEMYFKNKSREEAKSFLKEKYIGNSSRKLLFQKPKKKDGIYAILMDSNKFFYDRFYEEIDDLCFFCNTPIKGKKANFPSATIRLSDDPFDVNYEDAEVSTFHFCSYECKQKFYSATSYSNPNNDGAYQSRETESSGNIFGYIYKIENIRTNSIYIGQTRYLPMFRWQEHVKDGSKGDIEDLIFSVITKVPRCNKHPQKALDDAEAWWIRKYMEEEAEKGEHGAHIMNLVRPAFSTVSDFKERYDEMIAIMKEESLFDTNE